LAGKNKKIIDMEFLHKNDADLSDSKKKQNFSFFETPDCKE